MFATEACSFRKKGFPDLLAFLCIEPEGELQIGDSGTFQMYRVFLPYGLRFDATPEGQIDGTTKIIWSRLSQPAQLVTPIYQALPYPHSVAKFKDESL